MRLRAASNATSILGDPVSGHDAFLSSQTLAATADLTRPSGAGGGRKSQPYKPTDSATISSNASEATARLLYILDTERLLDILDTERSQKIERNM